jgi:hypothetical protein
MRSIFKSGRAWSGIGRRLDGVIAAGEGLAAMVIGAIYDPAMCVV